MSSEPADDAPTELPGSPGECCRSTRRIVAGAALIILATFVVYWPALKGGFVWDDLLVVEKNPLVKGETNLRAIWLQQDFPLTTTAFWLQWLAWGKDPAGYHLVNVLLHGLNALLVWRALVRLRIPGAWIAGILFAVHPVCVASVAWVSELKNTLSLAFFLISFLLYQSFDRGPQLQPQEASTPDHRAPRFWYWLSLVAFLLALLSKTSTVMLPVVLLGCVWWQRGRVTRLDLLRTSPFFALSLTFGLMSIWFQTHQVMGGTTVQSENFWGRLAGAGWALWFYLGKALLPLKLNMIYPRWTINAAAPLSYVPGVLWIGLFGLCWCFRRSWGRAVLFALGFFTVTLFPILGFFDMYFLALSRVSDHFQYLPLIAIVALIALGFRSLLPAKVLPAGVAIVILVCGTLTSRRAQVLAKDETLWRDTLAKNPAAWTAHNNLGCILAEQQKFDEAITSFEASLRQNPKNAQAHINLARALCVRGRFADAETHLQQALKLKPGSVEAHLSYAAALQQLGKLDEAIMHLREALQVQPDAQTRLQLATLLRATKQTRESIAQFREVLSLKPDSVEALNNLAWLLATSADAALRDGNEAVRHAEHACRLTQNKDATTLGTLAAAYAEAGRFSDAVATAQKASDVAMAAGNTRFAAINQQLQALYRTGKPYHEPATARP